MKRKGTRVSRRAINQNYQFKYSVRILNDMTMDAAMMAAKVFRSSKKPSKLTRKITDCQFGTALRPATDEWTTDVLETARGHRICKTLSQCSVELVVINSAMLSEMVCLLTRFIGHPRWAIVYTCILDVLILNEINSRLRATASSINKTTRSRLQLNSKCKTTRSISGIHKSKFT